MGSKLSDYRREVAGEPRCIRDYPPAGACWRAAADRRSLGSEPLCLQSPPAFTWNIEEKPKMRNKAEVGHLEEPQIKTMRRMMKDDFYFNPGICPRTFEPLHHQPALILGRWGYPAPPSSIILLFFLPIIICLWSGQLPRLRMSGGSIM